MSSPDQQRIDQAGRDYGRMRDELDERRRDYARRLTRIAWSVEVALIFAGFVYYGLDTQGKHNQWAGIAAFIMLIFGLLITGAYAQDLARKRVHGGREMTRAQLAMWGNSDESIEQAMRPVDES